MPMVAQLESIPRMLETARYYLSEHPSIVNFRWSHDVWGSTWSFLLAAIASYVLGATALHLLVNVPVRPSRRRPLPVGPIPALHSLAVTLASAVIFLGILLSASAEIRDTRWSWRRTKRTPVQWLLCFPLGTRPSGRVFFWSYIFYLSRSLHLFRTFLEIVRRRRLSFFRLFNQSMLLCMSFLWLEFSQSFQVLAILLTTLLYCVLYGYRFWTAVGLPSACFPFVVNCQVVALGCNLVCHFAVLFLHLLNGGCNGIGAWVFNSVLNGAILMLILRFYVDVQWKDKRVGSGSGSGSTRSGSGHGSAVAKEKDP